MIYQVSNVAYQVGFLCISKVIGTGMNGAEFARKAMHEAGVAIVPGSAFGETCQNYVRFSFAASRDNISQALENNQKNAEIVLIVFPKILDNIKFYEYHSSTRVKKNFEWQIFSIRVYTLKLF